jgi:uncharacterized protein (UPF0297 family)
MRTNPLREFSESIWAILKVDYYNSIYHLIIYSIEQNPRYNKNNNGGAMSKIEEKIQDMYFVEDLVKKDASLPEVLEKLWERSKSQVDDAEILEEFKKQTGSREA